MDVSLLWGILLTTLPLTTCIDHVVKVLIRRQSKRTESLVFVCTNARSPFLTVLLDTFYYGCDCRLQIDFIDFIFLLRNNHCP